MIEVDRASLAAALKDVQRVIKRHVTIPILKHCHIKAADGTLTLRGADLEIWIDRKLSALGEGEFLVEAEKLAAFLSRANADVVTLDGDKSIAVKCGRSRATLPAADLQDWPEPKGFTPEHEVVAPHDDLIQAIAYVEPAIAASETRYYLNGAHFRADAGQLVVESTDGYMFAQTATGIQWQGNALVGKELLALLKTATGPVRLACGECLLEAEWENTRVRGRLIDGTFPDFNNMRDGQRLGDEFSSLEADGAALRSALLSATPFDPNETKGGKRSILAKLVNGTLHITSDIAHGAWAESSVDVAGTEGWTFSIDTKQLLPFLRHDGPVTLAQHASNRAIFISTGREQDVCGVLPNRSAEASMAA